MYNNKTKILSKSRGEVLRHSVELKKKRRIGSAILFFFLAVIILAGLWYCLATPALAIKTVTVQGQNVLTASEIEDFTLSALAGNYLYFFPKRSVFLYPRQKLERALLAQFPRLKSARVSLADRQSILVLVTERDSDATWCRLALEGNNVGSSTDNVPAPDIIAPKLETEADCYFTDENGYIFAQAPTFLGSVFTELRGALPAEPIGTSSLSTTTYKIVSRLARYLPEIFTRTAYDNYRLLYIGILSPTSFKAVIADAGRPDGGEWEIFFDDEDSADALAENLFSVLSSPAFKKDMLDNGERLESIDLRYGKKVFYKFKN